MSTQKFSMKQLTKRSLPWLFALSLVAPLAAHSAQLKLEFQTPEQFSDLGINDLEREQNLQIFTQAFATLAQTLPQDNVLKVRVKDVDLAGGVRYIPTELGLEATRFLRHSSATTIDLEYTLTDADGNVLRVAEERLLGPNARQHGRFARWGYRHDGDPLREEREMLWVWFNNTFEAS